MRACAISSARIENFVHHSNSRCHPFTWTATADSIYRPSSPRHARA